MKTNTQKKSKVENASNITNENGILFSVGLIVKNEEKYLDRCLSALKPICDAIPTEIVVVDTGSTDRTVEIAKKHTDKVYSFEWIDDFSAARNYGLERCSGEWFMFIDADEIFDEDVSSLLDFLNSDKKDKYNSACIHLKNYQDDTYQMYYESIPTRIGKINAGIRFVNSIHECLTFSEQEHNYDIKVYAHHYGYIGPIVDLKKERNFKFTDLALSSSGLGHWPFTPETRVRIPVSAPTGTMLNPKIKRFIKDLKFGRTKHFKDE